MRERCFSDEIVEHVKRADILTHVAPVAELADAQGLGPCVRKGVWVQVPPGAQTNWGLELI